MFAVHRGIRSLSAAIFAITAIAGGLLAAPSLAAADDAPPVAYGGSVDPGYLDFGGGHVTISAEALDDVGIASVYVNVTGPDGFYRDIELSPNSVPSDPSEPTKYAGAATLPGTHIPTRSITSSTAP